MPSNEKPTLEWTATAAAQIYAGLLSGYAASGKSPDEFDINGAMDSAVEVAAGLWARAADRMPDPSQPRVRNI